MNVLKWLWWKRVREETRQEIAEGKKAAETGKDRLEEVRRLAGYSEVVRNKDQEVRDRNQFVKTFLRAFEEGIR